MQVAPGTIQVWSDLGCPWSHAIVWRLWDARRRLGLEDRIRFDYHVFPLELFNSEPTPRPEREAEGRQAAELAPRAGWQPWSAPDHAWPVTMLPPMEAVLAAKEQSLAASEELDRGLRRALWAESRCVSLRHVILEVAGDCDAVDVPTLTEALDDGRARRALIGDWAVARTDEVRGSAHLFAPDGTNAQNPGLSLRWTEAGGVTVDADDPSAVEGFLRQAAG